MTELKKTLKQGTPGAAALPVITPKGTPGSPPASSVVPSAPVSSSPISPVIAVGQRAPVAGVVAIASDPRARAASQVPPMPAERRPVAGAAPEAQGRAPIGSAAGGSEPPPYSEESDLPPDPTRDELGRTRPPPGHRTPSATRQAPDFGPPMQENAPGWMLRARRMSLALEEAIGAGRPSPTIEACIERAWAAWELDGSADKQIARVARLVEKAHSAIRETAADQVDRAYVEIAQVIWAGLPRNVKTRQEFAQIVIIVRELRTEADAWAAVVDATAKILGWAQAARAHSAHAVRVAILSEKA
jgi:hypothetical protein